MSLSSKWYRRVIVRFVECVLIGLMYVAGCALLVGAIWLICGIVSVIFKMLGVL